MDNENLNQYTISRVQQLVEWRRYDDALEEALKLIQADPESSSSYSMVGVIYRHMKEYEKAIHWSDTALGYDPENLQAWFVKTLTYYDTENWKKFDAIITEAISLDPEEDTYYYLLANRLQTQNNFIKAKEMTLEALKLKPAYGLYLANLSYCEALLGDHEASKELELDALKHEVESTLVFLILSWSADQRGDDKRQLSFLKSAIQLDPDNEQIRNEYLNALQKTYFFYRILLSPSKLIKKMKPWQILLSWVFAWIIFKPLIILFIGLYVLAYWSSKLLVHVKVFGWSFKR